MEKKIDNMMEAISKLASTVNQLVEGQAKLSSTVNQLVEGHAKLAEGQNQIIKRLDNIEEQLAENTRFINALSQDVARTATKDSITSLNSKFDLLNDRLFQTENKINLLAIVK
jgi:uncharacterized coiled-coil protein SlyX